MTDDLNNDLPNLRIRPPYGRRLDNAITEGQDIPVPQESANMSGIYVDANDPKASDAATELLNETDQNVKTATRQTDMLLQSITKKASSLTKTLDPTKSSLDVYRQKLKKSTGKATSTGDVTLDKVISESNALSNRILGDMLSTAVTQAKGQQTTEAYLSRMHHFQTNVQLRVMAQSLSVGYQQTYFLKAISKLSKAQLEVLEKKLEAIKHNTGSSEFKKRSFIDMVNEISMHKAAEQIANLIDDKIMGSAQRYVGKKLQSYGASGRFGSGAASKVGGFLSDAGDDDKASGSWGMGGFNVTTTLGGAQPYGAAYQPNQSPMTQPTPPKKTVVEVVKKVKGKYTPEQIQTAYTSLVQRAKGSVENIDPNDIVNQLKSLDREQLKGMATSAKDRSTELYNDYMRKVDPTGSYRETAMDYGKKAYGQASTVASSMQSQVEDAFNRMGVKSVDDLKSLSTEALDDLTIKLDPTGEYRARGMSALDLARAKYVELHGKAKSFSVSDMKDTIQSKVPGWKELFKTKVDTTKDKVSGYSETVKSRLSDIASELDEKYGRRSSSDTVSQGQVSGDMGTLQSLVEEHLSTTKTMADTLLSIDARLSEGLLFQSAGANGEAMVGASPTKKPGTLKQFLSSGKQLTGGIVGKVAGAYMKFARASIKFQLKAVTGLFKRRNTKKNEPLVDIYLKDEVNPGHPLVSKKQLEEGLIFADGSPVESAYDIDQVVMAPTGEVLISTEDLEQGLVNIENEPLSSKKWSIAGKAAGALGSGVKGVGRFLSGALKSTNPLINMYTKVLGGIGKGILEVSKGFIGVLPDIMSGGGKVLKGLSDVFVKPMVELTKYATTTTIDIAAGAAKGAGRLVGRLFGIDLGRDSKKGFMTEDSLETILGQRLDKIYTFLEETFGVPKKDTEDKNEDGIRDGSYQDRQLKKQAKLASRRARIAEKMGLGSLYGKAAGATGGLGVLGGLLSRNRKGTEDQDAPSEEDGGILEAMGLGAAGSWVGNKALGGVKSLKNKVFGKKGAEVAAKAGVKVGTKTVGKTAGKALGKSLLKKIPGVGLVMGLGFAADRILNDGDWVGGGMEALSGVLGTIPFFGTAASALVDAGLATRDIMGASEEVSMKPSKDMQEQVLDFLYRQRAEFYGFKKSDYTQAGFKDYILGVEDYFKTVDTLPSDDKKIKDQFTPMLWKLLYPGGPANPSQETMNRLSGFILNQMLPMYKAYQASLGAMNLKEADVAMNTPEDIGRFRDFFARQIRITVRKPISPYSIGAGMSRRNRRNTYQVDPLKIPKSQPKVSSKIQSAANNNGIQVTDELGSVSAKWESGKKGSGAIGYDSTGGTSYGKYQIASATGTFDKFLEFAEKSGPQGAAVAARLRAAGAANTGSDQGGVPAEWRRLAKEGALGNLEHEFIKSTHYDAALKKLPPELQDRIGKDKALQQTLWSTAVQHGAGGAASIFKKTQADDVQDYVSNIYAYRGTQFGSSTDRVRANVQQRFRDEQAAVLKIAQQNAYADASRSQPQMALMTQDGKPVQGQPTPIMNASLDAGIQELNMNMKSVVTVLQESRDVNKQQLEQSVAMTSGIDKVGKTLDKPQQPSVIAAVGGNGNGQPQGADLMSVLKPDLKVKRA